MELFETNRSYRKVLNLIEKLEHPVGWLCENINDRVQVTRNEILDWLNSTNDNGNLTNGKFASVTYVEAAKIQKTKKNWDHEKMAKLLDKYKDTHNLKLWYKYLKIYNEPLVTIKNPMAKNAVIVVQRYVYHWKTPQQFRDKYVEKYAKPLYDLRMSYNLGVESNGLLGDNNNPRHTNDYGLQFNQTTGNPSIDFDMKECDFSGKAFFANGDGTIITDGIPYDVIDAMWSRQDRSKPEVEAAQQLSYEDYIAYAQARREIIKGFKPMNLKMDQILCIAAWDGEDSFYYINDNLTSPIQEGGEVLVNRQQMIKLAEEQLDEVYTGINDFASNNGTGVK